MSSTKAKQALGWLFGIQALCAFLSGMWGIEELDESPIVEVRWFLWTVFVVVAIIWWRAKRMERQDERLDDADSGGEGGSSS